jgi:hypothetical protein
MERGVILVSVTTDKTAKVQTNIVFVGIKYENDNYVKELAVKFSSNILFKFSEKLYTFYTLNEENNQVEAWQAWSKHVWNMLDEPREVIKAGLSEILPAGVNFCPVDIQQCPLNPSVFHVTSRCFMTKQRFTFSTYYEDRTMNTKLIGSSLISNINAGPDFQKASNTMECNMGYETL